MLMEGLEDGTEIAFFESFCIIKIPHSHLIFLLCGYFHWRAGDSCSRTALKCGEKYPGNV